MRQRVFLVNRFFRGAAEIYGRLRSADGKEFKRKTAKTLMTLTPEAEEMLKKNLTAEYDFFHFVQDRLLRQYRETRAD